MNRSHALVAALALALALPAAAQNATDPKLKALPPPALNDPGHQPGEPDRSGQKPIPRPVPYDQAQDADQYKSTPATSDAQGSKVSAANLPDLGSDGVPEIVEKQEGENKIQEFRQNGKLYQVVVVPKNGIPQYYDVDDAGNRTLRGTMQNGVRPTEYKVYEWGNAPKPVDSN
ncbi:Protein of unknown function [Luteibacter sp. UNC138MFCol5.1]|uniref:DUF2782 domain-containing protein n=1 Tax=Luteibacter sp. UNC138MFCol5.1 TaxID=1502774 RepID=UPI0008C392CA|nr:DUF2782 domain-containing protein [Luteibacter sp. UNC138MFCol5.1]SEO98818.1 Protein of unknown function [Luteibacter sp. UNC138MFCol5.1]